MFSWQITRLADSLTTLSKDSEFQKGLFKNISPTEEMGQDYGESWRFVKKYQLKDIPSNVVSICDKIDLIMSLYSGRDCDFWRIESLDGSEWTDIRKMAREALFFFNENNANQKFD